MLSKSTHSKTSAQVEEQSHHFLNHHQQRYQSNLLMLSLLQMSILYMLAYDYFSVFLGADEKEDSILGSILLPSFHISMLSVDDHISRKYAFKVKHKSLSERSLFWIGS